MKMVPGTIQISKLNGIKIEKLDELMSFTSG